MEKEIRDIIGQHVGGTYEAKQKAVDEILRLFSVSKRHLLESIIEDMDGKHYEYHREVVKNYLDDGC